MQLQKEGGGIGFLNSALDVDVTIPVLGVLNVDIMLHLRQPKKQNRVVKVL